MLVVSFGELVGSVARHCSARGWGHMDRDSYSGVVEPYRLTRYDDRNFEEQRQLLQTFEGAFCRQEIETNVVFGPALKQVSLC